MKMNITWGKTLNQETLNGVLIQTVPTLKNSIQSTKFYIYKSECKYKCSISYTRWVLLVSFIFFEKWKTRITLSISVRVTESPACCNIATTVYHSNWSAMILQLLCNRLTCLLWYCHHCVVTNKKHHSWQYTLSQLLYGCSNKHSCKQKQDSTTNFLVITVPKMFITQSLNQFSYWTLLTCHKETGYLNCVTVLDWQPHCNLEVTVWYWNMEQSTMNQLPPCSNLSSQYTSPSNIFPYTPLKSSRHSFYIMLTDITFACDKCCTLVTTSQRGFNKCATGSVGSIKSNQSHNLYVATVQYWKHNTQPDELCTWNLKSAAHES